MYLDVTHRAFSCDVSAAMLEGKNNTFSLPWEIRFIFMQNCFIVSALQQYSGRREKHKTYIILHIIVSFTSSTCVK